MTPDPHAACPQHSVSKAITTSTEHTHGAHNRTPRRTQFEHATIEREEGDVHIVAAERDGQDGQHHVGRQRPGWRQVTTQTGAVMPSNIYKS